MTERADRARRAIGLIDLTDLSDDHCAGRHRRVVPIVRASTAPLRCASGRSSWRRCAELLAGSGVRVATVVNFPSGDEPVADVLAMARTALADGADDIDLVLPYRAFLDGDPSVPARWSRRSPR